MHPGELGCDEATFRNYAGVEENVATETELLSQIDLQHMIAFIDCPGRADDTSSFSGKQFRYCLPNTPACAGHQCDPVI